MSEDLSCVDSVAQTTSQTEHVHLKSPELEHQSMLLVHNPIKAGNCRSPMLHLSGGCGRARHFQNLQLGQHLEQVVYCLNPQNWVINHSWWFAIAKGCDPGGARPRSRPSDCRTTLDICNLFLCIIIDDSNPNQTSNGLAGHHPVARKHGTCRCPLLFIRG